MANQRILDDSEKDGRTEDGASNLGAPDQQPGPKLRTRATAWTLIFKSLTPKSPVAEPSAIPEVPTNTQLAEHSIPPEQGTRVRPVARTLTLKSFSKDYYSLLNAVPVSEPPPAAPLATILTTESQVAEHPISSEQVPRVRPISRTLTLKSFSKDYALLNPLPVSEPTTPSQTPTSPTPKSGPRATAPTLILQSVSNAPLAAPSADPDLSITEGESTKTALVQQVSKSRPVARTLILRSLSKDHTSDDSPNPEPLTAGEPTALTAPSLNYESLDSEFLSEPKPRKRATAPTLIFKAIPKSHLAIKKTILEKSLNSPKQSPLAKLKNTTMESNRPDILTPSERQAVDGLSGDGDDKPRPWFQSISKHPILRSQLFQSSSLLVILSTVLLVCCSALMKALHSERQDVRPAHVKVQNEFRSCDNHKSLWLSDKTSELILYGKSTHGQFKNLTDNDFFSLIVTPAKHREIWFQRTDAGLVDQDGTILYANGALELALARKMERYGNLVATRYKETKLYPSDTAKLEKIAPSEFHYTNPFSGKVDEPVVLYKRFAAADKGWTEHTQFGQMWADEPRWKPGDIHCICLDYCRFFIRGFDRNARPLTGTLPGSSFYIELKDGINLTPNQPSSKQISEDKDRSAATFYVSNTPGMPLIVTTVRQLIPIVILILFSIPIAWLIRHFILKSKTTVKQQTKFKI